MSNLYVTIGNSTINTTLRGSNSDDTFLTKTNNLSDVNTRQTALNNLTGASSATNEYVLTKDTATGNVIFKEAPGASGGEANQNAFSYIAVSGQDTVSADSKTDTLNLVAGSGITLSTDASGDSVTIAASGTSGEANTASNVGTSGVGIFKQKDSVDLEFKKINAGSNKVNITDDTGNDEVDIDIAESNIDLNNCDNSTSAFISASGVTYENLNSNGDVGTGASQVAAGNHSHGLSGSIVGTSDTQTLTNKTIAAGSNTISGVKDFISGLIESPANQDYMVLRNAPFAGTINKITTKSSSGTCILTGYIGATALGGTANSVSSTEQAQTHSSSNTFSAGDDIKLTVSSNSSCEDLEFTVEFTRNL